MAHALKWDIDILFSNAGIGENGPVCEIPVDLVRRTFESNVFAPLELVQKFIRKWVDQKRPGKVVFTSSFAALITAARSSLASTCPGIEFLPRGDGFRTFAPMCFA